MFGFEEELMEERDEARKALAGLYQGKTQEDLKAELSDWEEIGPRRYEWSEQKRQAYMAGIRCLLKFTK